MQKKKIAVGVPGRTVPTFHITRSAQKVELGMAMVVLRVTCELLFGDGAVEYAVDG